MVKKKKYLILLKGSVYSGHFNQIHKVGIASKVLARKESCCRPGAGQIELKLLDIPVNWRGTQSAFRLARSCNNIILFTLYDANDSVWRYKRTMIL